MPRSASRRLSVGLLAVALTATLAAPVAAQTADVPSSGSASTAAVAGGAVDLDLENLTAHEAIEMMEAGELTSVQLTQAYLDRIEALNRRGPALNAVTQLNEDALNDAAALDAERAAGIIRGPAHGLPTLLKDLIDAEGMYTSNGNYSLRESFPEEDAGVVKLLRERGQVILGKVGLTEYANSFGAQPSGFGNLTGQVLNAIDTAQNPSGSSSGSGTAAASALSMFTVGTETSGSITSPSNAQSLVGIRPTVGIVPAYGIGPISSSQDTAGPMDRTVSDAAMNLQSMVGRDPKNEAGYEEVFGPNWEESMHRAPEEVPDYLSALRLDFVEGKQIGYNNITPGSSAALAFEILEDAGAIMVPRASVPVGSIPGLPGGYQQHNAINMYYANLGPDAPIQSLAEEVAANQAEPHQALKFGHNSHLNALNADVTPGGANQLAYQAAMPIRRAAQWNAINTMMNNGTPEDPSDDVIAILGSVPSGAAAGTPQITIPMGYSATLRRATGLSIHGNAHSERDLIGVAYVIEQGTQLRESPSELNPSMYRCADTVPAPPYAERGSCNPDYASVMELLDGESTILDFALELESAASLQDRLAAGTLTSEELTKAYLTRIALSNAEGPATQAVRSINLDAIDEAVALDSERTEDGPRGPLHGLPVLLDDSIDAEGLPTTGGSIALQYAEPDDDAALVASLKDAGAIVLGKTNISELGGLFDSNLAPGYSSLGGKVLVPSDAIKSPDGSSAGSAAATASGLAALTVGRETSLSTARLLGAADRAGVVGLKPTVGRVSRDGVMPVALTQDSPGPLTRTVEDAAIWLEAVAGEDPADPATVDTPEPDDYLAGLSEDALEGKTIAVISSNAVSYPQAVAAIEDLGATTVTVTLNTNAVLNLPQIVTREFKRDLDAYLADHGSDGAGSLQEIIDYNLANPVEGLKFQQRSLVAAQEVDLTDVDEADAYEADLAAGLAAAQTFIDNILDDDIDLIVVPRGNDLVEVANRAGYPALTVPSGYGVQTTNEGRNPFGVTFVGTAFSEAELLAVGYAFEQETDVRLAPSYTNPSMWRCVEGSDFFTAELCHPGDLLNPAELELDEPELELELAASTRCVASNVYVTVTARNDNDVPVDIEIESAFGSRSFSGVAPGRFASQASNTRSASVDAGSVTVSGSAVVDGADVSGEWTLDYGGLSCG